MLDVQRVYMLKLLFSDTWPAVLGFLSSKNRVIDRSNYTPVPLRSVEPEFELQHFHSSPRSGLERRRLPSSTMEKTARSGFGHTMRKLVSLRQLE